MKFLIFCKHCSCYSLNLTTKLFNDSVSQGKKAIVKWCLMLVSPSSSFMNDVSNWDLWAVTSHSIASKHDIHSNIMLTAVLLLSLLPDCRHVYEFMLSFTNKMYFRSLFSVGSMFNPSAWTTSIERSPCRVVDNGLEIGSLILDIIQCMQAYVNSLTCFLSLIHRNWSEITLEVAAYARCPLLP